MTNKSSDNKIINLRQMLSFLFKVTNKLFLIFMEWVSVTFRNWKKPDWDNLDHKSVLIIRHGGIGDILFISPFIKKIKTKSPTTCLTFMTRINYHELTNNIAYIDKTLNHAWPNIFALFTHDYVLFLDNSIEKDPDAEKKNVYDLFAEKYFFQALSDREKRPVLSAQAQELTCTSSAETTIGLQLKSGSPIRTPSQAFWLRTASELLRIFPNALIVLIAEHREESSSQTLLEKIHDRHPQARICNFATYSRSINDLISLINQLDLVIAPDSSVVHIAAAFQTPAIGIYGPFPGALRTKYYPDNITLDAPIACGPCFTHGHSPCKKLHNDGHSSACFDRISTADITKAAKLLLSKKRHPYYAYLHYYSSATSETARHRHTILQIIHDTTGHDLRLLSGLDLGCGGDPIVPEAVCLDLPAPYTKCGRSPIHVKGNAINLHWFAASSLDYIYSSHLFEDFNAEEQYKALGEWSRVLHDKGMLILLLPHQQRYISVCRNHDEQPNEHHKIAEFSPEYMENFLLNFPQLTLIKIYQFWNLTADEYNFLLIAVKQQKQSAPNRNSKSALH